MAALHTRLSRPRYPASSTSALAFTARSLPPLPRFTRQFRPKLTLPFTRTGFSCRSISLTIPRATQARRSCRDELPIVHYDPKLGDPWAHYRLRNAKPLPIPNFRWGVFKSTRVYSVVAVFIALSLAFYTYHLEVVPVSGRRRFNCISDNLVRRIAQSSYEELMDSLQRQGVRFLPAHDWRSRRVQRVMARLLPVAGEHAAAENWEVRIIDLDNPLAAQAFLLPGGKILLVSGLLRLARTEGELAVVLSHELAHNMAKHTSERLSQYLIATALFGWLAFWLSGRTLLDLLLARPMSRMQESEADYIGLMMMSEACYNPQEALEFWARMVQMEQQIGVKQPEFMSTHPSHEHRLVNIKKWMPQALEKRELSDCSGTQGFAEMLRRAMETQTVLQGHM